MITLKPHDRVMLIASKVAQNIGLMGTVIKVTPEDKDPIYVLWDTLCLLGDGNYSFSSCCTEDRLSPAPTIIREGEV